MRTLAAFWLATLACLALAGAAHAVPVTYTDAATFLGNLTGPAITADFDSLSSGDVIALEPDPRFRSGRRSAGGIGRGISRNRI